MKNLFCKGWIKLKEDISVMHGPIGLKVEVANHSDQNWISAGNNPVYVCYHWFDENWNMVVWDGHQTHLSSGAVAAGASIIALAEVSPPEYPGAYHLVLTLVREGMYWFEDTEYFEPAVVKIRVEQDAARNEIGKVPDMGGLVNHSGTSLQSLPGDNSCVCIKAYEKGRRFGFMHIKKTAGLAMNSFLLKVIRPKTHAYVCDRIFHTGWPNPDDSVLPQVDCYLGHISLEDLLKCCPDGQYLTVFREASCRILSHWLYWASFPKEIERPVVDYPRRFGVINTSLMGRLLNPKIACQFDNVALRMLVWPHQAVPDFGFIDKKDDAELLELAMDRLKRFSYVDVIENPRFESNLKEWLGTEVPYERQNVTATIANQARIDLRREFTAGALEALEARTRLDRVLWTTVAAARLPGVDLARLTRDSLMTNVARYSSITSLST